MAILRKERFRKKSENTFSKLTAEGREAPETADNRLQEDFTFNQQLVTVGQQSILDHLTGLPNRRSD